MGDYHDALRTVAQKWEIYGINQDSTWQGTSNILVGDLQLRGKGDKFIYEAHIYTPPLVPVEDLLNKPVEDRPSLGPVKLREKAFIHSDLDLEGDCKPQSRLMLLQVLLEREHGDTRMKIIVFQWQRSNYTTWTEGLPQCALKAIELFSGGWGGWSLAIRETPRVLGDIEVRACMDHDRQVNQVHRKNYGGIISADDRDQFTHGSFEERDLPVHWTTEYTVDTAMVLHRKFEPDVVMASPPCPPWSAAASSRGLDIQDGVLMLELAAATRLTRPYALIIENVENMDRHAHWPSVEKAFEWAGYTKVLHEVLDIKCFVPTSRRRLILLYVDRMKGGKPFPPELLAWASSCFEMMTCSWT